MSTKAHIAFLKEQFLNYLPLLYASKQERCIFPIALEEKEKKRLKELYGEAFPDILEEPYEPGILIEPWMSTQECLLWAKTFGCTYEGCDPLIASWADSKERAFEFCKDPYRRWITSDAELDHYLESNPYPKLFKEPFALSGKGHFFKKPSQWKGPLLAEVFCHRLIDFSSQWFISQEGRVELLGLTLCHNNRKGKYLGTTVLPEKELYAAIPHLDFHIDQSLIALQEIAKRGFFGNIGVDAMLYRDPGDDEEKICPIVEINARKTMGYAALKLCEKLGLKEMGIELIKNSHLCNLLPNTQANHALIITGAQLGRTCLEKLSRVR